MRASAIEHDHDRFETILAQALKGPVTADLEDQLFLAAGSCCQCQARVLECSARLYEAALKDTAAEPLLEPWELLSRYREDDLTARRQSARGDVALKAGAAAGSSEEAARLRDSGVGEFFARTGSGLGESADGNDCVTLDIPALLAGGWEPTVRVEVGPTSVTVRLHADQGAGAQLQPVFALQTFLGEMIESAGMPHRLTSGDYVMSLVTCAEGSVEDVVALPIRGFVYFSGERLDATAETATVPAALAERATHGASASVSHGFSIPGSESPAWARDAAFAGLARHEVDLPEVEGAGWIRTVLFETSAGADSMRFVLERNPKAILPRRVGIAVVAADGSTIEFGLSGLRRLGRDRYALSSAQVAAQSPRTADLLSLPVRGVVWLDSTPALSLENMLRDALERRFGEHSTYQMLATTPVQTRGGELRLDTATESDIHPRVLLQDVVAGTRSHSTRVVVYVGMGTRGPVRLALIDESGKSQIATLVRDPQRDDARRPGFQAFSHVVDLSPDFIRDTRRCAVEILVPSGGRP